MLTFALSAKAFDCGDVPTDYQVACDNGGADVCTVSGGNLVCDLGTNGESTDAHMWAVSDSSPGDIVAWGLDGNGAYFCCEVSIGDQDGTCTNLGTVYSDEIRHQYDHSTLGAFDLDRTCTAYGYEEDDLMLGSRTVQDIFYGGAGPDVMRGFAGGDHLYGEGGADLVVGGPGVDLIDGGTENDTLDGGDDADTVYGGPNDDTISGGSGDDLLLGEGGADVIVGEDGNDSLYGGADADQIRGHSGDDYIEGNEGDDQICPGVGHNDEAYGNGGEDQIYDSAGNNDTVDGGANEDDCINAGHEAIASCENMISTCPF